MLLKQLSTFYSVCDSTIIESDIKFFPRVSSGFDLWTHNLQIILGIYMAACIAGNKKQQTESVMHEVHNMPQAKIL